MNFGPITTEMTIAIRPAIRTRTITRDVRQVGSDAFEPDRARRLDEHRVAGADDRAAASAAAHPAPTLHTVTPRELARPRSPRCPSSAAQLADLRVVPLGVLPELGHAAEDRQPRAGPATLGEVRRARPRIEVGFAL